ncbi:glycine--tRNA ligase [Malacoplasma muris]|uniref:glycine--tRNA ligase n=1 Tax=Malacoplasma muris TaxID=2119 RepID=UPI00398E73E9
MKEKISQEIIVNHLKNYGFVFQNSEIYGGLANAWDFGPLGAIIKNLLKNIWINYFVTSTKNMFLIDTNIILNSSVWDASGHINNFSDPLIDCKKCKNRFRADKLIGEFTNEKITEQTDISILEKIINNNKIKCPNCKNIDWTNIRKFNLMFETSIGVVDNNKNIVYLRPETAQGIFINFKNIQRTTRAKIPFGVAQIGKSFRNEITPSNFIFRTREFEQMEIEHFVEESQENMFFDYYINKIQKFLFDVLKLKKENISIENYSKDEIAHYSKKTIDFFYDFPHGKSELWGLANRGSYDLMQHESFSKKDMHYLDSNNNKFIPSVIEPSVGLERLLYAILIDAYDEEQVNNETRVVMRLDEKLAPYKIAVLPLTNKLEDFASKIYQSILNKGVSCTYDTSGSIGKRYRRQDAIGTPYCLTVDFDSQKDMSVTIRNRDSMEQVRVNIKDINLLNLSKLFK